MSDNIENLILEHLKRLQAEQTAARERDQEILSRLSHIESGIARLTRDERRALRRGDFTAVARRPRLLQPDPLLNA